MTALFEASNGVKVIAHDTSIGVRISVRDENPADVGYSRASVVTYLDPRQADALREFYDFENAEKWQAKRDAELGRWRWPENPDYVVYLDRGDALVMSESDPRKPLDRISRRYCEDPAGSLGWGEFAARAYFEAHPERKPWADAQPGDVWVFEVEGVEQIVGHVVAGVLAPEIRTITGREINLVSSVITGGRRIWPEDAS